MATTRFHSAWFQRALDGTQPLDLDGAGSATIKLGIVTDTSINGDTTNLYTSLTPVSTGTGWTGPVTLSGVTAGLDGSFDWVFDANDPAQIPQDASTGFNDGNSVIIYENLNKYILYSYTADAAFGNVSGPITINFNSSGILKITL